MVVRGIAAAAYLAVLTSYRGTTVATTKIGAVVDTALYTNIGPPGALVAATSGWWSSVSN